MKVLSIDSATESASCAVIEDNKLLGEINFNYKKQHSVILMTMVDFLLKNLNLSIKDMDGFAISKGPGSFTGLRIGAATVKGFSQGTNKPFIAISTLDSLAYNLAFTSGIICPILDALRNNVYTCTYTFENGSLKKLTDHCCISLDDLIEHLNSINKPVTFVGDGTDKFKDYINSKMKNVSFAPSHLNNSRASALGELALNKLSMGLKDNIFDFSPTYLRKSQAEREYDKKMELLKNEK